MSLPTQWAILGLAPVAALLAYEALSHSWGQHETPEPSHRLVGVGAGPRRLCLRFWPGGITKIIFLCMQETCHFLLNGLYKRPPWGALCGALDRCRLCKPACDAEGPSPYGDGSGCMLKPNRVTNFCPFSFRMMTQ